MSSNQNDNLIEVTQIGEGLFVSPPMTMERYALLQGLETRVIENQVRRGYLPTIKRGKYRLINTYKLAAECLES